MRSERKVNRAGKERTIRNRNEVGSSNDITAEKERSGPATRGN